MGYTTFTGPIRAGNILDTTGTLPGVSVGNVGQVVMAQSAIVLEGATPAGSTIAGLTTISIPAYSQILSMQLRSTVAFTAPISIAATTDGTTVSATYFTDATGSAPSVGLTSLVTTTATQNDNWMNVGYPDTQIVVSASGVGAGEGVLTVTYIQGPNGNT